MILTKFIYMPEYKILIKKREDAKIKHLNDLNDLLSVQIRWMMFMRIFIIII